MHIDIKSEPRNRSWIIFDIESAVIDETGHRRYQQMERYVPHDDDDDQPGRRVDPGQFVHEFPPAPPAATSAMTPRTAR